MNKNLGLNIRNSARYFLARLKERLWFKPFVSSILSIAAVYTAGLADQTIITTLPIPEVTADSIETLLKVLSASMLVIAVFAVGAMISAYASASASATPRSFPLVVGDDVSQNALSTFIGSFIFSILALVALLNDVYSAAGRFTLFILTLFVFTLVILSFMRWVDRIARLGRLGNTIEKVEKATRAALALRNAYPTLGGNCAKAPVTGAAVYPDKIGFVQNINMGAIQCIAEELECHIILAASPGSFVFKGKPIAHIENKASIANEISDAIASAFIIGPERTFESDPDFGLTVLSEIACRALSPAINDPGTAKGIVSTMVRLFGEWSAQDQSNNDKEIAYPDVFVPNISLDSLFDNAFNAIARDGAACVEVAASLQEAFYALSIMGCKTMRKAAASHSELAIKYAEHALILEHERNRIQKWAEKIATIH